jgi:hypothetical protein
MFIEFSPVADKCGSVALIVKVGSGGYSDEVGLAGMFHSILFTFLPQPFAACWKMPGTLK